MEIKAKLNYLHIAPRKVRLVTDFIRGMEVKQAENYLRFIPKRVSVVLLKLLQSTVGNAEKNFKLEKDALYIKQILVNEGVPFKRQRPVSRGRAFQVLKRTSNINLVLGVKEGAKVKKIVTKKAQKSEEPQKETTAIKEISKEISKKPKLEAPREIGKTSRFKGLTKKIFRRKSF